MTRKQSEMRIRNKSPLLHKPGCAAETVTQRRYQLRNLLKGTTPKAMHEAYDWGPERGREIVDK